MQPLTDQQMKGQALYRIISTIVNIIAMFMIAALVVFIPAVFVSPASLLPVFLLVSMVLYSRFANRFYIRVIFFNGTFTTRQKDWLQVNAIVTAIVSVLWLYQGIATLAHPQAVLEQMQDMQKQYGQSVTITLKHVQVALGIVIFIFSVLLIHVIWTFMLVRINRHRLEDPQ